MRRPAARATLIALGLAVAPAQPAIAQLPPSAATFPANAASASVPFTIVHDLIVIDVAVNGSDPLRMILDTGAPVMLVPDAALAERLGLRVLGQASVGGGGDGPVQTAPIAAVDRAEVGGVTVTGMLAVIGLAGEVIPGIDGVIGGPLFANTVVTLDWDRGRVVFTRPDAFSYDGEGAVVSLEVRPSLHAYVTGMVSVGGETPSPLTLHLDTGARRPLAIFPSATPELTLPDAPIKDTIVTWGSRGVGRGDVALTRRLALGDAVFEDVLTAYPRQEADSGEQGRLGLEPLREFRTIIDYPRGRLILDGPRRQVERTAFTTIGIILPPSRDRAAGIAIADVIEGSPAAEAGLVEGETLVAIDGVSISGLSAAAVRARLAPRPGDSVVLTLVHDGTRRDVRLVGRRLIGGSPSADASLTPRDGTPVTRNEHVERQRADAREC